LTIIIINNLSSLFMLHQHKDAGMKIDKERATAATAN